MGLPGSLEPGTAARLEPMGALRNEQRPLLLRVIAADGVRGNPNRRLVDLRAVRRRRPFPQRVEQHDLNHAVTRVEWYRHRRTDGDVAEGCAHDRRSAGI